MELIEPSVEYWPQENPIDLVCRCARVCYQSSSKGHESNVKMYDALVRSGHVSMLRHASHYYIIRPSYGDRISYQLACRAIETFRKSPYLEVKEVFLQTHDSSPQWELYPTIYVSTNANFLYDNEWVRRVIEQYETEPSVFQKECPGLVRFTFMINVGRIINDEYVRKSPNAIAGESTRYCNYSKDKFGGEIKVSTSESYDNEMLRSMNAIGNATVVGLASRMVNNFISNNSPMDGFTAEEALWFSNKIGEIAYIHQTQELKRNPDDSRNCLPINVSSRFVYTYSVREWSHILQMRLLNMTGKAHADARKVAELLYGEFQKLGYNLNNANMLEYNLGDGKLND